MDRSGARNQEQRAAQRPTITGKTVTPLACPIPCRDWSRPSQDGRAATRRGVRHGRHGHTKASTASGSGGSGGSSGAGVV